MPLPSQKAHQSTWLYGSLDVPGLSARSEYLETYKPGRVRKLASLVREYRPTLVIFYSLSYLDDWKAIIGTEPTCLATFTVKNNPPKKLSMYAVAVDKTLFCVIPQSNARGMSYQRLYEYADRLKEQFTIPPEFDLWR